MADRDGLDRLGAPGGKPPAAAAPDS
jgi:hypothetical protein